MIRETMKTTLALAVILAAVAVVCDSSAIKANKASRANLIVGNVYTGDKKLYSATVYRAAAGVNTVQSQDLVWRGNSTNKISAVQAMEYGASQNASAWIFGGGINYNNVSIRFQSAKGRGYYYLLDIWGR